MGRRERFTAQQVIDAIKDTGGIKAEAARRLGCDWRTVDRYIKNYATVRQAYEQECETVLDLAESIMLKNLQLARKQQDEQNTIVDTGDAKWVLSMKGRKRGYAPTQRQEWEGKDGGPLVIKVVYEPDPDRPA
jgi:hypothetical protein